MINNGRVGSLNHQESQRVWREGPPWSLGPWSCCPYCHQQLCWGSWHVLMLEVRWMYMVPAVARYQEEVHEPCSCWLERKKESSAVVVMITNLQFKERDVEGFSDNSYTPQTKSNNLEGKMVLRGPPLQQLRETGEDVWHQYNCKHIQETFLRFKA